MGKLVRQGTELRNLLAWAKERGFECERTGADHLVFRRPETMPVFASFTPSCKFARQKTMRDLKHALIDSEQRRANFSPGK